MSRIKLTPANPVEDQLGLYVHPQAIMVVAEADVQGNPDKPTTQRVTQIILLSGQVLNVLETPEEIEALESE